MPQQLWESCTDLELLLILDLLATVNLIMVVYILYACTRRI